MLAIGMPGPFEWILIAVFLVVPVLALLLAFRIWRHTGRRK
jgi:hypothetical protein